VQYVQVTEILLLPKVKE